MGLSSWLVPAATCADSDGYARISPAAIARPSPGCGSNAIFTGTRCTIFVKLPVALSGGSSANCEPLAGRLKATLPLKGCFGKCIHPDFGPVARVNMADLRFFYNWPAPKGRFEPARLPGCLD